MIDTAVGVLNVPELEALVALNVDLAERYQAIADDCDAEPQTRGTAEALAAWRRARARYFREEWAEADRVEAERVEAEREPDLCNGSLGGARPSEPEERPASSRTDDPLRLCTVSASTCEAPPRPGAIALGCRPGLTNEVKSGPRGLAGHARSSSS